MSYNLFRGGADSARKREYYNLYYAAIEERKQACLHVRQKVMNDFNNLAALQQQVVLTNISRLAQASRLANIVTASAATTMRENPEVRAIVEGHTDSTGPDAYNQQLSERRAGSVIAYMTSHGVQDKRLISVGAGEKHPVASNATPDGRQLNRRVEITIVPVQQKAG